MLPHFKVEGAVLCAHASDGFSCQHALSELDEEFCKIGDHRMVSAFVFDDQQLALVAEGIGEDDASVEGGEHCRGGFGFDDDAAERLSVSVRAAVAFQPRSFGGRDHDVLARRGGQRGRRG